MFAESNVKIKTNHIIQLQWKMGSLQKKLFEWGKLMSRRIKYTITFAALLLGAGFAAPSGGLADSGNVIHLGAPLSFTGQYAVNGKHAKKGYEIARKVINENGGVDVGGVKYKINIIYYDDESNPAIAAKFAKRLITNDKVNFLLGPYGTSTTAAVAPVAEKYRMPFVQGNGASLSLFDKGYKYMFAVLSSADKYLSEALNLAAEQAQQNGVKPASLKIAIAVENDAFSSDLRDGVIADAHKFGMQIVIDEKLPRDFKDMTFILDKVKAEKPDILVVSGHEKGADLAIRQIHEQKVNVPMLAMTHCEGADIHGRYGLNADYTICSTQWDSMMKYAGKYFKTAHEYRKHYEQAYGIEPPYQAAESSAAVIVLADAIERAGTLDTEKVREALTKTDLETFFGWVKFDASGQNIAKPVVLRQLLKGRYIVIAPSGLSNQKVIYPRPKWDAR